MSCIEIELQSAEYCPKLEDANSGIEANVLLWPSYSILLQPTELNAFLIANKEPITLPCIVEKSSVQTKGRKGGVNSEVKVRIQNTAHNRGVIAALLKCRFSVGIKEVGGGDIQVFGNKKWETNQTAAQIQPDSVLIEYGTEFSSDKYIEFTFSTLFDLPVYVNNYITANENYEVSEIVSLFLTSYNNSSTPPFNGKVDEIYVYPEVVTGFDIAFEGPPEEQLPNTSFVGILDNSDIDNIIKKRFNALFENGNGVVNIRILPLFPLPISHNLSLPTPSTYSVAASAPGWHICEFVFRKTENNIAVGNEYRLVHFTNFTSLLPQ